MLTLKIGLGLNINRFQPLFSSNLPSQYFHSWLIDRITRTLDQGGTAATLTSKDHLPSIRVTNIELALSRI